MGLFLNWLKLHATARRPPRTAGHDYHAARCEQELAMARTARSSAAAEAHRKLAAAHRSASERERGSSVGDR